MSQFHKETFSDTIDAMVRSAHAGTIDPSDLLTSDDRNTSFMRTDILDRDPQIPIVDEVSIVHVPILERIHDRIVQHDETPDYLSAVIASAIVRIHEEEGRVSGFGGSLLALSDESLRTHAAMIWIRSKRERRARKPIELYAGRIGAAGITALLLEYDTTEDWSLSFELRTKTVHFLT